MPSFRLEEIPHGSSFEEVIPVLWFGNKEPREPVFEFIFPVRGTSAEAKATAQEDCRKRVSTAHSKNPHSHYLQIVDDDDNGRVISVSEVHVYETNDGNPHAPKDTYPDMETMIYWWPEGSDVRKFVGRMFNVSYALNRARKTRPHITIINCVTDPKYRRQGAATMLVEWVAKKADELKIEAFVAAHIDMGVPLYKKVDFLIVDRTVLDMEIPNPSDEWKECQKQLGDMAWDNMWRPVGGKHEAGAKYPWEE